MSSRSYLPSKLGDRRAWYLNFATYLAANFALLGLSSEDNTTIQAKLGAFEAAYGTAQNADTRTPTAIAVQTSTDNDARITARYYANIINANPNVSDEQRSALQLTIRAMGPGSKTRITAPASWPVLTVRNIGPLTHTLIWRDSEAPTQKVRAKPFGAIGVQLFQYIGATPPSDSSAASFIGNFTRLPIRVQLDPSHLGQSAYYYARWYTARGLEGPLVGPVVATVANG